MKKRKCKNCKVKISTRNSSGLCVKCCAVNLSNLVYKAYIKKWKKGLVNGLCGKTKISNQIRRYLFEKYNNKCSECNWGKVNPFTKKVPLEVEHKDGNYKNNKEKNLQLLCPNCHSLTKTYKGGNRGKGRPRKQVTI